MFSGVGLLCLWVWGCQNCGWQFKARGLWLHDVGGFHDLVGVPVSGSHALSGCARGWVQRCRFRWVFGLVVGSGLRVENVRIPDAQLLMGLTRFPDALWSRGVSRGVANPLG